MITCKQGVIHGFSKENKPVISIKQGETIEVETLDCFANQLRNEGDTIDSLDWDNTNPATGPIFVEGAQPGDTLKVTINDIRVDEKGTVACIENEGTVGHMFKGSTVKIVHIEENELKFNDEIKIPIRPMIGVIGVAPKEGMIGCATPGEHGGNMDNTMVEKGATLYFPIEAEGALLALGDVHAVMGDGEIGVTGLEIPAVVSLTVEVIKEKRREYPMLENKDSFSVIVSKPTADEAMIRATELMVEFIEDNSGMSRADVVMLLSLVADMQICQIVDPLKTVRFVVPKKYFKELRF